MDDLPTVSIITVVRNGMPFVADTVASVLAQDHSRIEYWVIDGGSSDGTVELVRSQAARLAGWVSEPDAGIADAFNKGIARSRGDYLMFLNADDALAAPGAISAIVGEARRRGWPEVIYGDCDLVDRDSGAVLYRYAREFDRRRFLRFGTLPHPSLLMHRRYFERHGRFDPTYRIAMDYEHQLRGVPACGAVRAPVLVTRVRTGGRSTLDPGAALEESIRALRGAGYLGPLRERGYRAYYGARSAARRALGGLGLYRAYRAAKNSARR